MSINFTQFIISILTSIIATYIIILFIKIVSYFKIREFFGTYIHEDSFENNLQHIFFLIQPLNIVLYIFNPIQNIEIKIERKSSKDEMNWKSIVNSDILNIFQFKGAYYIKKKPEGGKDGWLDMFLFSSPKIKIALHLHYINNNKWIENEAYYIIKN